MKFELCAISPTDYFKRKLASGDWWSGFNKRRKEAEFALYFYPKKLFKKQRIDIIVHPCKIEEYKHIGKRKKIENRGK